MYQALTGIALSLVLMGSSAFGGVIVNWTGSADFDDETITFTSVFANSITDIDGGNASYYLGGGGAFIHAHGGSTVFSIDLRVDGSWVNVFNQSVGPVPDELFLNNIVTPITFTAGNVDGLRAYVTPNIFNAMHQWGGGSILPSFTFDSVSSTVPEPTSVGIFGALLGATLFLRRKAAKV